ncbi:MAG TPA: protein translocase subunit SecF, partial [Nitriliruptorales bacterium]
MRKTRFDFIGRSRLWLMISATLMAISVIGLVGFKLDLSIDFVGGSSFVVEGVANTDITAQDLDDAVTAAGATGVTAQVKVEGGRATGVIVRTGELDPGSPEEQAVKDAVLEVTGADEVQVSFVGPTWGQRISAKALQALIVFLILIVAYISVRLEPKMAGAAVVALVHDLLLTAGVYAIVGFQVSPSTVIALLTILGYSLYDTVVVFDRIKENTATLGGVGRRTYSEAVNTSMNEVWWRSLNTTMTSLLPVGSLLFLGSRVLGAQTLQDLALALFVGMATGAYSSLFVAGPLLAAWKEHEPEMER